jgi:hypothetical protein
MSTSQRTAMNKDKDKEKEEEEGKGYQLNPKCLAVFREGVHAMSVRQEISRP